MKADSGPSGFIPVSKPAGITSFDVIRELRRQLHIRRLGHSGVLDKPATGVLVVGANRATRLFELFSSFEKTYQADLWLGFATTTDDLTGELSSTGQKSNPTRAEFEAVLRHYIGTIDQLPPAFSLAKVGGKELYRYALEGEEVTVDPKRVTVLNCDILQFESGLDPDAILPEGLAAAVKEAGVGLLTRVRVRVLCIGGVYIRSLARDIGADLGTCGCLGQLVRLSVGPFELEDCLSLEDVANKMSAGDEISSMLWPLSSIAPEDARLSLDPKQLAMVRSGQVIRRFRHNLPPSATKNGDIVYGLDPGHELVVILAVGGVNQHGLVELRPIKVLA